MSETLLSPPSSGLLFLSLACFSKILSRHCQFSDSKRLLPSPASFSVCLSRQAAHCSAVKGTRSGSQSPGAGVVAQDCILVPQEGEAG